MVEKIQLAVLIGIFAALAWIGTSLREIARFSGDMIEAKCYVEPIDVHVKNP